MAQSRELGAGAWSYFGDPRAISHDGHTFTGWISTVGHVWVARLTKGGKLSKHLLFRGLGRDDHNNPSLVFLPDGRLCVFFCPHSGRFLPPKGIPSVMRYRISARPYSIDAWGPVHTVPTNVPGGLGYTYPNPLQQRGKLWLFWRGGDWNPTFSYSEDRLHWVPARELLRSAEGQRPYAKYVGDGREAIHAIFSNGHVMDVANSLYYVRYAGNDLFDGKGGRIASLAAVPVQLQRLDPVYRYSSSGGRAWPHDIALTSQGRPRIVYTRRLGGPGGRDTFWYAYHNGERWVSRKIVEAGAGRRSFTSGGATLDHEDPRHVYLSRTIGRFNQVERWFTPDEGRTWTTQRLTDFADRYAIRPVTPRGLRGADRALFVVGDETTKGFTDFRSRVHALDF